MNPFEAAVRRLVENSTDPDGTLRAVAVETRKARRAAQRRRRKRAKGIVGYR